MDDPFESLKSFSSNHISWALVAAGMTMAKSSAAVLVNNLFFIFMD